MYLIFEGIDKSGKTTLAKYVAELLSCRYVKRPRNLLPIENKDVDMIQQYNLVIDLFKDEKFVVLDRFYPSEIVYSYLRGKDKLKDIKDQIWDIDFSIAPNAIIFILETDKEQVCSRLKELGEDIIKEEDVSKIMERYSEFEKSSNARPVMIDKYCSFREKVHIVLDRILNLRLPQDLKADDFISEN